MASRAVIVQAKRTPIGKFLGAFTEWSAVELGTDASRAVIESAGLSEHDVDEVFFGHARQAGAGPNPARQITKAAGLDDDVPAYTINAACGSGMKAVALGADSIRLGRSNIILCGGVENMTQVPFMLDRARVGYRLGHSRLIDGMYHDGFLCRISGMIMGETAEVLAEEYDISRKEQDAWALMSQHRVEASREMGRFAEEIVPVTLKDRKGREKTIESDEHPRDGVTIESLAKLPPVFSKTGTVTAGNASGITDGAAAVVLMSEDVARERGLEPLARVRDFVSVGVDPRRMGIGPVPATRRILENAGMTLDDVPVIELNEAFAAQVIACERELRFDRDRVNKSGGAISLGHPIGCTGARIVVTLLYEMKRADAEIGLATLCVSGGLGMAMLLERA